MRVGLGYDMHPYKSGRKLILGGVQIPHESGLDGHSDADALCHALTDAVLGGAAKGSIGDLFPDSDPSFEGADSLQLLATAVALVRQVGFRVVNVDAVIVAQGPRLAPYLAEMAERLAGALQVQPQDVGLKATSPEHLGALGRGEGVAVQAVALLESALP